MQWSWSLWWEESDLGKENLEDKGIVIAYLAVNCYPDLMNEGTDIGLLNGLCAVCYPEDCTSIKCCMLEFSFLIKKWWMNEK